MRIVIIIVHKLSLSLFILNPNEQSTYIEIIHHWVE